MVRSPIEIPLEVEISCRQFDIELENKTKEIDVGVSACIELAYPDYPGTLVVTPTQEQQVLHTRQTSVHQDIVIAPIPHNYGLIEWNGSSLKVS